MLIEFLLPEQIQDVACTPVQLFDNIAVKAPEAAVGKRITYKKRRDVAPVVGRVTQASSL